jgi:hypothetical protein
LTATAVNLAPKPSGVFFLDAWQLLLTINCLTTSFYSRNTQEIPMGKGNMTEKEKAVIMMKVCKFWDTSPK